MSNDASNNNLKSSDSSLKQQTTSPAHTPTPWTIDPSEELPLAIIRDDERGEGIVEFGTRGSKTDEANANRIVDCVNACEGINPEAIPDLLKACESMVKVLTGEEEPNPLEAEMLAVQVEEAIAKARE